MQIVGNAASLFVFLMTHRANGLKRQATTSEVEDVPRANEQKASLLSSRLVFEKL